MTAHSVHTGTFADLERLVSDHERSGVQDSIKALSAFRLDVAETRLHGRQDPFSAEYYRDAVALWSSIAARSEYDPSRDELAPYLDDISALGPVGERNPVSSLFAGEQLQGIGWIMQQLDLSWGGRLLEYGPGDGKIALQMARLGCRVATIDIEARYLEKIQEQARALRLKVETQQGVFGDAFGDGRQFDRILFYEAFHHALDHAAVLKRLHNYLAPNGYIVFAAEPIIRPGTPWDDVVPFPWGPRLDGMSVHAMRAHGWCELGFRDDYFIELLMRSGYLVTFRPCPGTDLGSCYIATPYGRQIDMGDKFLIALSGDIAGWHEPEAGQRYTSDRALFPIDARQAGGFLEIEFFNFVPVAKIVDVVIGNCRHTIVFDGQCARREIFDLPDGVDRIEFLTETTPMALYIANDERHVGIGVRSISYAPNKDVTGALD